jgi:hypothetical protein
MVHAGRTVTVESTDRTFRVTAGEELLAEVARTATKPIARFKVRKPEPPRQHSTLSGKTVTGTTALDAVRRTTVVTCCPM